MFMTATGPIKLNTTIHHCCHSYQTHEYGEIKYVHMKFFLEKANHIRVGYSPSSSTIITSFDCNMKAKLFGMKNPSDSLVNK
ncbi:hypothetical protein ERO13_D07G056350v2 [Gossypium hirsutum]|uniref:Uncharacterized protein n=4 Tax=Gossypium TaxID=3633 RepID=A0A0D2PQU1_GOSRA|nr:hypothetical protein ES319_D07G059000v1 [Gossypium barbadense]KAG4137190.1 hypothetical protein ERO13_D07G056350v2 [Gossypium hirsutum]KJB06331.1 hypothetical protein B456_001G059800 [Gossypium raimondii]TYG60356.1 hypothetical protein ES288_D07G062200v1 [Gossypium darwinii]TYI72424.1 hypothetical protein E1A91_D07G061000v1 [Gossypium mustelinum]